MLQLSKKVLAGKGGRLDDEELEYLAREITKRGFKLGFACAYASGAKPDGGTGSSNRAAGRTA